MPLHRVMRALPLVALAAALLFLALRWPHLGDGLPYYAIDENDVVESALAFTAGDRDPYWYKYGPLTAYLLAALFGAMQAVGVGFSGWSDLYDAIFADPARLYLTARLFHSGLTLLLCAVAVHFARRHYGREAGWIALILFSLPLFELLSGFTIRVDTLLGLTSLATLLFATGFGDPRHRLRNYLGAGLFLALGVATKPIPGLLVIPALLYAHFVPGKAPRVHRYLLLAAVTALAVHFLVHPYSLLKLDAYLLEQWRVVTTKADQGGVIPGWNFGWLAQAWGVPLALALGAALIAAAGWRERASRILTIYVITFCALYLPFEVREYWYAGVLPAALLLLVRLIQRLVLPPEGRRHTVLLLTAALLPLMADPVAALLQPVQPQQADLAAQRWIEANLPADTPILTVGWYPLGLPRLTATDFDQQATWGEHFVYGREHNSTWIEAVRQAHRRYLDAGHRGYFIRNIRKRYRDEEEHHSQRLWGVPLQQIFDSHLDRVARLHDLQVIVTASPDGYRGRWEGNPGVELLQRFRDAGNEVKVFRVEGPRPTNRVRQIAVP